MRDAVRQDRGFVQFQRIGGNDLQLAGLGGGDFFQRRQAARIALHRDHLVRAFAQQRARQSAGAGPDFVEGAAVLRAGGAGDLGGEVEIEQEVLAQRFLGRQAMRGDHLAQRRQLIGPVLFGRASAISAAIFIAAIMLRASALPVPAISSAVP